MGEKILSTTTIPGIELLALTADSKRPEKAHHDDAMYDVFAVNDTVIPAGETHMVSLGFRCAVPPGWHVKIYPRSSWVKKGLHMPHSVGIIDSGYRGEVFVVIENVDLINDYHLDASKAIAQMEIVKNQDIRFKWVDDLSHSERGEGGFGSTDTSKVNLKKSDLIVNSRTDWK